MGRRAKEPQEKYSKSRLVKATQLFQRRPESRRQAVFGEGCLERCCDSAPGCSSQRATRLKPSILHPGPALLLVPAMTSDRVGHPGHLPGLSVDGKRNKQTAPMEAQEDAHFGQKIKTRSENTWLQLTMIKKNRPREMADKNKVLYCVLHPILFRGRIQENSSFTRALTAMWTLGNRTVYFQKKSF